jgi:hypothetical protein
MQFKDRPTLLRLVCWVSIAEPALRNFATVFSDKSFLREYYSARYMSMVFKDQP